MTSLDSRDIFAKTLAASFSWFITACKWSLQRLCFHRCLSVHRGVGWGCLSQCMLGYTHPWAGTPPRQVHPLGRYTHPQVHPRQVHPLRRACWHMVNKWAVHIPLECILVWVAVRLTLAVRCVYSDKLYCVNVIVRQVPTILSISYNSGSGSPDPGITGVKHVELPCTGASKGPRAAWWCDKWKDPCILINLCTQSSFSVV